MSKELLNIKVRKSLIEKLVLEHLKTLFIIGESLETCTVEIRDAWDDCWEVLVKEVEEGKAEEGDNDDLPF